MTTTIITEKGSVDVPDEIREALGLRDGDVVSVERLGDTVLLRRSPGEVDPSAGILARYAKSPSASIEDEREAFELALAEEVAGRNRS